LIFFSPETAMPASQFSFLRNMDFLEGYLMVLKYFAPLSNPTFSFSRDCKKMF